MSSEGSSRLRQFGLYKTIDTQTAEFLKLSRKRQIRRGCACAAVSTAITVTVVVVALLIYEFGFRTDLKSTQNSSRQLSWINVVNDSIAFDKHQSPIKNHGKLLALILKSLDQKRYLETIIEEQTSLKPQETTEYFYQRNIFSDRKLPGYNISSELQNKQNYSIGTARKVMDYQRVITYLTSMSFTKKVEETRDENVPNMGSNYQLKENIIDGIFVEDNTVSKAETKRSRNSKTETKTVTAQNAVCACSNRSKLTGMLDKLYNSIQQLHPLVKLKDNKMNSKQQINKTATVVSKKYKVSPAKKPHIKTKKSEHSTTTILPQIRATNTYSPKPKIRNNDTLKSRIALLKQRMNETTTESNLLSRIVLKDLKTEEPDTILDDVANIYVQAMHIDTKHINNSPNENSSDRDVTEKIIQMTHNGLYELIDKEDSSESIQDLNPSTSPSHEKNNKVSEDFSNFDDYLSRLGQLQNLIVNKPQASVSPKKDSEIEHWSYKHSLQHEIIDPPTEMRHKYKKKNTRPSENAKEMPVLFKYLAKNGENQKSAPDLIVNGVDANIPLTPMIQSFLLSKQEKDIILSLDETTTLPNKLQKEDSAENSAEELPFNLKFSGEDENFISMKLHKTTPIAVFMKHEKNDHDYVQDITRPPQEKARRRVPVNVNFDEDDKYFNSLKIHTTTSATEAQQYNIKKDEHVRSLKETTTITYNEAQKNYMNKNVDDKISHTKTFTAESQKVDRHENGDANIQRSHTKKESNHVNRETDVISSRKHTKSSRKKALKHHINRKGDVSKLRADTTVKEVNEEKAWSLWREEKQRGKHVNTSDSPKKSKKKSKKASKEDMSTKQTAKPTTAPTPQPKRSKIKEIFYMTGGDEPAVDDFETKLSALMYFDESPVNYTAIAHSFINKADSVSVERSKSMMPETQPSNLEIRRNHEVSDLYTTNWYNNDDQSVYSINF